VVQRDVARLAVEGHRLRRRDQLARQRVRRVVHVAQQQQRVAALLREADHQAPERRRFGTAHDKRAQRGTRRHAGSSVSSSGSPASYSLSM
jgi:hypothetical protein